MNTNICPTYQSPIPENAPGGLCPACVLRDAGEAPAQGPGAPSIGEIAAAFPQWEVIELIGQGGMGFVCKVRQPSLDRIVALKILSQKDGGPNVPACSAGVLRPSQPHKYANVPVTAIVHSHRWVTRRSIA